MSSPLSPYNIKNVIMRNGRKLKDSRIYIDEDMARIGAKSLEGKLIDTLT